VLHLLIVPVITFLTCNSFVLFLTDAIMLNFQPYNVTFVSSLPYYLCLPALLLTCFYGLYLHFFRHQQKKNYFYIAGAGILSLFWCFMAPTTLIWVTGCLILFSFMRSLILKKGYVGFGKDFMWTVLAGFLAAFMFPMSYTLSIALFLTMQILFEMNGNEPKMTCPKDAFRDSYRMADSVLKGLGS